MEMERHVKEQALDWMNQDNEFSRSQIDAAAMVATDLLRELDVLESKKDENGKPMLYVSFGKYEELYGICHDYDEENHVWQISMYLAQRGRDDILLCGPGAGGEQSE